MFLREFRRVVMIMPELQNRAGCVSPLRNIITKLKHATN